MAIEWSDNIVVANLADEPALSDELATLNDRMSDTPESETPHLVLDFSNVSYINSSNIAQMLRLQKRTSGSDRTMKICSVSDEVWSVMMVTGLDKVFRFAPDIMTALAGIQLEQEGSDGRAGG